jgi:hypothetical protein
VEEQNPNDQKQQKLGENLVEEDSVEAVTCKIE